MAQSLGAPWDVAFAPDGRAFVTERDSGWLKAIGRDGKISNVQRFDVARAGEAGLLGLAVSPDFASDGLLYAYMTTSSDNRIVRFRPGQQPQPIVTGIPSASLHDGGRIAFGPDGLLYAGTGDATQSRLAQDPDSLAGKVLRMTRDGKAPSDNPRRGSLVYSLGHRNVQGLAWDRHGRLFVTELGPNADDEVNRIEPGGNYGWPEVTGRRGKGRFVDPVAVFQPPEASPSGAAILRGKEAGAWEGNLIFAALRGERLWRLALTDDGRVAGQEALFVQRFGRLRQVKQAPDGSLWVLTNNRDGRGNPRPGDDHIFRVRPPGR